MLYHTLKNPLVKKGLHFSILVCFAIFMFIMLMDYVFMESEDNFNLYLTQVTQVQNDFTKKEIDFDALEPASQSGIIHIDHVSPRKILVNKTKIKPGATIKIKPGYIITFKDEHGNTYTNIGRGDEFRIIESCNSLIRKMVNLSKGGLRFQIKQKIYFQVHFKTIRVYVKGTDFEVIERENGAALEVKVHENQVVAEQDYAACLEQSGRIFPGYKNVSILKAGEKKIFRLTFNQAWQRYRNYQEMIEHFRIQLDEDLAEGAESEIILKDYNNLGLTYLNGGNFENALASFNSGLKLSEKKRFPVWLLTFQNNKGIILARSGNTEAALKIFLNILTQTEKMGSTGLTLGVAYTNLGNAYFAEFKIDKAFKHYINSKTEYDNAQITGFYPAQTYIGIANCFLVKYEGEQVSEYLEAAEEYYKKAEAEYRSEKIGGYPLGQLYNNIGTLYYQIRNLDAALKYYKNALRTYQSAGVLGRSLIRLQENIKTVEKENAGMK